MSAEQVCEAISFKSENPVDYCSHLARQGCIVPVPGRRATYTRASVMKYIESLCNAANVARRSHAKRRK
jgi:hypothetical protein